MTTKEILNYLQTVQDCKKISLQDAKTHKDLILSEKDNTEYFRGTELYYIPVNSYGTHGFIATDIDLDEILETGGAENFSDWYEWTDEEREHQLELFSANGILLSSL